MARESQSLPSRERGKKEKADHLCGEASQEEKKVGTT